MSSDIQAVLFDLDGTLLDTHDLILVSFRYATQKVLGRVIPDEKLMQKVGQPLTTQMWDFTDDQAIHDELLTVYRDYNHSIHDEKVRTFEGVPEMLAAIKQAGLPIAVVTSKLHWLANRGLECTKLADYVDVLVGPDDYPDSHKPDPGPVLYGAKLLGVDPEKCWYVGDSPFDMAAGNGAGCQTAAALWGMFSQSALEEQHPTMLCTHPCEVIEAILE